MSDIFVSYASADRDRARVVAEALAARGLSVWWDRVIPPGRQFDDVIEEALDAARCVVVLWSHASTASTWVKTEAAEALRGKALIPALIEEGVKIPLEFRRVHAADLSLWRGDPSDPKLLEFLASVERELNRTGGGAAPVIASADATHVEPPVPTPTPTPVPPPQPDPKPARKLSPVMIGAIAAAIIAVLGAGMYFERARSSAAAEQKAAQEQAARAAAEAKAKADAEANGRMIAPPAQRQGSQARAVPTSGTLNLRWRDSALGYTGALTWTPNSAVIRANVVDLRSGTSIGNYNVPARINQTGGMDYTVTAEFAVPGDSTTPGPHSHTSRLLVRAQQDGSLRFLQNCPRPGECY